MTLYFIQFIFQNRTINHAQGSHGVPGIFVKYDLSSFKVHVREEHKPFWQFLVRLCGIIGGVFATSGQYTVGLVLQLSSMKETFRSFCYTTERPKTKVRSDESLGIYMAFIGSFTE